MAVPLSVRMLLRRVSRRLRLTCLVRLATTAWLGLAFGWLALYLADRCGDTASWVRLSLCAGVFLVWLAAAWGCWRGLAAAADPGAVARRIMAVDPPLGHLLLSAVELAADGPPGGAPRPLVAAALAQVGGACMGESAARYVSLRAGGPTLAALALCTAGLVPAVLSTPGALPNVFARLLCPLSPIPRMTRIRLSAALDRHVVPRGEPSVMRLAVAAARGPLPATLSWRLDCAAGGRAPVDRGGNCQVRLPGVERQTVLRLRCGDARSTVPLCPRPRPTLTRLEAVMEEAAGRPGARSALLPGTLHLAVAAKTNVRLEGWADQTLAAVHLVDQDGTALPVAQLAAGHFTAELGCLAAARELRLACASADGLWTRTPYRLRLEAVPDAPPHVQWCGENVPASVLPTARLTVAVCADDDVGLERLELHAGTAPGHQVSRQADCTRMPRRAALSLTVCPADLGLVAGQSLSLEAVAADGAAGHAPVKLTLDLTVRAVAAWIEDLSGRMHRVWRRLEQIAAAEDRQADAEQAAVRTPPGLAELDALLSAGVALAETDASQTRAVCGEMDRLITAAIGCEELDATVAAAWAEARAALGVIAEQSFPALLTVLRAGDPSRPCDRLSAALPWRRELVQALRALLAADEHFRRCAARTAALRLLEAARAEQALATDLGSLPDAWAGQSRDRLDATPRAQLDALAQRQERVAADLDQLGALLHDLAARGAPGAYALVAAALDATNLVTDLGHAAVQVRRNHRFFALSTAETAAALMAEWAAALDAGVRAEAGSAGGGQGGTPGGVGEVALRLRRALVLEEGLRERTRLAAQMGQSSGLRQALATTLAARQAELALSMPDLSRLCPGPLVPLVDQGAAAMQHAAQHLLAGRFDAAEEAQAAASEWLTACLQPGRDSRASEASGNTTAAGTHPIGLGQTGTRGSDETPLGPAAAAEVQGAAWAPGGQARNGGRLRAASVAEVPAPYRLLWEKYRRRLQEMGGDP